DLRKRSGAAAKYLFDDRSPGGALSWALLLVDVDAEPSTLEMAVDQQVRQQVLDHIDRHREANSPTPAEDCGVPPHDLAAHVEQRYAGVARVDQRVGLDEIVERPNSDHPFLGGDNSLGDGVIEPEGIPNCHHPVADLELVGVSQEGVREIADIAPSK